MFNKMAIRRVIYPVSSAAFLSVSVSAASDKKDDKKDEKKNLVRRSELPIYPVKDDGKSEPTPKETEEKGDSFMAPAMKEVDKVVQQVREVVESAKNTVNSIKDKVNTGIEHARSTKDQVLEKVRDPDSGPVRHAAIATGGLVGYIIAIRRGVLRKIVYTGTGAAAVATIIYPEEAKEISADAFAIAKKYIVIAYHFINGDALGNEDTDKKDKDKTPKKTEKDKGQNPDDKNVDAKNVSYGFPTSQNPTGEGNSYYNMYSRRA